ncbi:MAG: hypothetical protein ACYDGY_06460 [Acidimicrobiales bacterium]
MCQYHGSYHSADVSAETPLNTPARLDLIPLSAAGTFTIWNSSGSTDVTVDVVGYVG